MESSHCQAAKINATQTSKRYTQKKYGTGPCLLSRWGLQRWFRFEAGIVVSHDFSVKNANHLSGRNRADTFSLVDLARVVMHTQSFTPHPTPKSCELNEKKTTKGESPSCVRTASKRFFVPYRRLRLVTTRSTRKHIKPKKSFETAESLIVYQLALSMAV